MSALPVAFPPGFLMSRAEFVAAAMLDGLVATQDVRHELHEYIDQILSTRAMTPTQPRDAAYSDPEVRRITRLADAVRTRGVYFEDLIAELRENVFGCVRIQLAQQRASQQGGEGVPRAEDTQVEAPGGGAMQAGPPRSLGPPPGFPAHQRQQQAQLSPVRPELPQAPPLQSPGRPQLPPAPRGSQPEPEPMVVDPSGVQPLQIEAQPPAQQQQQHALPSFLQPGFAAPAQPAQPAQPAAPPPFLAAAARNSDDAAAPLGLPAFLHAPSSAPTAVETSSAAPSSVVSETSHQPSGAAVPPAAPSWLEAIGEQGGGAWTAPVGGSGGSGQGASEGSAGARQSGEQGPGQQAAQRTGWAAIAAAPAQVAAAPQPAASRPKGPAAYRPPGSSIPAAAAVAPAQAPPPAASAAPELWPSVGESRARAPAPSAWTTVGAGGYKPAASPWAAAAEAGLQEQEPSDDTSVPARDDSDDDWCGKPYPFDVASPDALLVSSNHVCGAFPVH